jgi:phosphohistidine phosphatase
MNLILWRHAEAEDGNPGGDMARGLTKRGRKQAKQMAHWLDDHLGGGDWKILVSPAQRTLQTVEPLGREFEVSEALSTATNAERVLRAAGWPDARNVLVVGHQPTLGEVASILLNGEEGGVAIRKGAIWWFVTREREGKMETTLKTVLEPDQAED